MDEPEKQPDEEQPVRSRRALAGESVVTDTAVGDERIFGFHPRDQPRPDEEQPTNEQVGVLDPRRGGGQPDKAAAARSHWLNWPDW
jgi:hypothetical protein